ncbi:TauD domain-containing protein [Fusarium falciforme]|uniref:TauD domain-containing protein n=1 Tax=Fusarium falciforme TaxID=195108 RepID=UPI0022FFE4BF|nr:TauD domain-containing protein [Fusarium falciforme]WAO85907.1 TauD domain-containing protein [Fusarium falciforme]
MAPAAVEADIPVHSKSQSREPLKLSGALKDVQHFDVTPAIGREFPKANLVEWLEAPNSDELIRDLAITISQRGVVFFRAQNNLTNDLQKKLILRLGELTGRPASSTLHIHPLLNSERELGGDDLEVSTISSKQHAKFYRKTQDNGVVVTKQNNEIWHSDVAFEPAPADYTSLRLVELPKTGGDTLWASGYDVYDHLSPAYQKFLERLTATFEQPNFAKIAERSGFELYDKPRGSPDNVGRELRAIHPVVRTNPVTGWKSVFPIGAHVGHINDVTAEESENLLKWFYDLVAKDHSIQVRLRWENPNDIAIWDNRSVFHSATFDYDGLGDRFGNRVVGVGERPYFDPKSASKRETLQAEGN